jgi:hypothetical protein
MAELNSAQRNKLASIGQALDDLKKVVTELTPEVPTEDQRHYELMKLIHAGENRISWKISDTLDNAVDGFMVTIVFLIVPVLYLFGMLFWNKMLEIKKLVSNLDIYINLKLVDIMGRLPPAVEEEEILNVDV